MSATDFSIVPGNDPDSWSIKDNYRKTWVLDESRNVCMAILDAIRDGAHGHSEADEVATSILTAYAKEHSAPVYHLYVRKEMGGRVRLTVYPMPKERVEALASKLMPSTRSRAFILLADPSDNVIPEVEL